jgi:cell division protein FtsN
LPGSLSSSPVELESSVPDTVGKHEKPIPEDSLQREDKPPTPSPDESIQEIPQVLETKGEDSGKTQSEDNSGQGLPPEQDVSIHTSRQLSFSVQVGAFLSRGNAERMAAMLREKGYPSRMLTMLDYANKSWYTVRLGSYATLQEAKKEASDFSDKEKITATVRPVDAL